MALSQPVPRGRHRHVPSPSTRRLLACPPSQSQAAPASCISVRLKRRVSAAISSLVLVPGQKVSRLSAAGGHKLNAIAKINDFQMICHLFPEPIRWSSLEIEFGNMRKRKKGNNKNSCSVVYGGRRLGRITICSE